MCVSGIAFCACLLIIIKAVCKTCIDRQRKVAVLKDADIEQNDIVGVYGDIFENDKYFYVSSMKLFFKVFKCKDENEMCNTHNDIENNRTSN